jgi:hypothetical protein
VICISAETFRSSLFVARDLTRAASRRGAVHFRLAFFAATCSSRAT